MTNQTIPTLESIADLTAIEAWQASVTEQTDVSLLSDNVFLWGNELSWCVVFGGKLIGKDLPLGDAFIIYAKATNEAAKAIPFQGEHQLVESEE